MRARDLALAASVALAALVALAAPHPARADAPTRRFGVLVAHHDGGPGTTPLRYARRDAEKVRAVLEELGGAEPDDVVLLSDPTAEEVEAALSRVDAAIARAQSGGAHTTLVVYYSGHARGGELRLGATRLPLARLRAAIGRAAADVRIGILDACESGAITRTKGGRPVPALTLSAGEAAPTRGLVLIASSAENEASQESDLIGGSYFTHYLVSGLRGDADTSGDRRVTLAEVYQYAYQKTVLETVDTRGGVQHPTYGFDLEGSGQLVLTELARVRSGVVLGAGLDGRFLVVDRARGELVAELTKAGPAPRAVALVAGRYRIKRRLGDVLELAEVTVPRDAQVPLEAAAFRRAGLDEDTGKGLLFDGEGLAAPDALDRWQLGAQLGVQLFLSGEVRDTLFPPVVLVGVGVARDGILGGRLGVDAALGRADGQTLRLGALSLPYDFFAARVGVELTWIFGSPRAGLLVGPRLGGHYARRSFPNDPVLAERPQDHFGIAPAATGGFRIALDEDAHVVVEGRAHLGVLPFGVDANRVLTFVEGALWLAYRP